MILIVTFFGSEFSKQCAAVRMYLDIYRCMIIRDELHVPVIDQVSSTSLDSIDL